MKKEFLDRIDEFLLSSLREGKSEAVDAFLIEHGYSLEEIHAISDKSFKRVSFTVKAETNAEKDERLLEKAARVFKDALERNMDKPVNFLKQLSESKQVSFQHRNLDKLSIDEIKSIIRDYNLLEILENLEDEEEL